MSVGEGKESVAKMFAYALREAGTLLLVFVPLYKIFEYTDHPVSAEKIGYLIFCGLLALFVGILVERKR